MSNNKTRQELLKEKAEKETRQIALLQHCTKIDQGLKSMPENAGNRAIWELVQNARDLSENCTIRIELTKDKFIFAHKGEPFTFSTFSSLIQQVSPWKSNFALHRETWLRKSDSTVLALLLPMSSVR